MTAISRRSPPVAVEYDYRGRRKTKQFSDAYVARRFYVAKLRQGKNPKVQGERP